MPAQPTSPPARRRGSAYVLLLGMSVILAVIGVSGALVSRVQTRSVEADSDWAEAQVLATSAAEHALAEIAAHADWRTRYAGVTRTVTFGRGTMRWNLTSQSGGGLTSNAGDPFQIVARGQVNRSAYGLGLQCTIGGTGLTALKTCVHSGGQIIVRPNATLTVTGGAASSNDLVNVWQQHSVIHGDVEAASTTGGGTIDGKVTVPAPAKPLPDHSAIDLYRGMATALPAGASLKNMVLGPGVNPWGSPNANGIYYLDATGKTVTLQDCRISGTLVVKCSTLQVKSSVLLESTRTDLPTLIVDGDASISFTSGPTGLSENGKTNLNPPGAPYQGQTNNNTSDVYPSEIRGLVHVTGDVNLDNTSLIRGCLLCEGTVTVATQGNVQILHGATLPDNPPAGYTQGTGQVVCGQWKRVFD